MYSSKRAFNVSEANLGSRSVYVTCNSLVLSIGRDGDALLEFLDQPLHENRVRGVGEFFPFWRLPGEIRIFIELEFFDDLSGQGPALEELRVALGG